MINNKNVILWVPAGRQRYMELLIPHLIKNIEYVDEIHLWRNTRNDSDARYLESLANVHPKIKIREHGRQEYKGKVEYLRFVYPEYKESNTVYIKVDDDVVYIEPNKLKSFIEFRINNPQYFLVYPMTVNNPFCMWKASRLGIIPNLPSTYDSWESTIKTVKPKIQRRSEPRLTHYMDEKQVLCPDFWGNNDNALMFHRQLIEHGPNKFHMPNWELTNNETVSINFISWLGESFQEFNGQVDSFEDETWLATFYPIYSNKINCVYGDFVVSHFSYYPQMKFLDSTDLLMSYGKIND
jgi:hypothetical protein